MRNRDGRGSLCVALLATLALLVASDAASAAGEATHEVSVSSSEVSSNESASEPVASGDGRFVAFTSTASNLVPGDSNGMYDGFVRDRSLGTTERVTIGADGVQGDRHSFVNDISPDGRWVAFQSWSTNLVPGIPSQSSQVYRLDRSTGAVVPVSVMPDGTLAPGFNRTASISADGRYVAFMADQRLVPQDPYGNNYEIYVRDLVAGTTTWATHDAAGGQADGWPEEPSLSDDGRTLAFASYASDLIAGDTNDDPDIFVRDLATDAIERVSVGPNGAQADYGSLQPALSGDGQVVGFASYATNLIFGALEDPDHLETYVHDRATGETERISRSERTCEYEVGMDAARPSLSTTGRFVAYIASEDLTWDDGNGVVDVVVVDRSTGDAFVGSRTSTGGQGDDTSGDPALSGDGRYLAFKSFASNVVPNQPPGLRGAIYMRYLTETDSGTQNPTESGLLSGPVHNAVEPIVGATLGDSSAVHALNCTIVVPAGL